MALGEPIRFVVASLVPAEGRGLQQHKILETRKSYLFFKLLLWIPWQMSPNVASGNRLEL